MDSIHLAHSQYSLLCSLCNKIKISHLCRSSAHNAVSVTNHYLVLSISPSLSARRRRSRADVEGGAYEPLIEGGVL